MRKLNVLRPLFEAVQITDATFDDPHPNPEHIPYVIYSLLERCCYVPTPSGSVRADLGDWIVRDADDELHVAKGEAFRPNYAREAI